MHAYHSIDANDHPRRFVAPLVSRHTIRTTAAWRRSASAVALAIISACSGDARITDPGAPPPPPPPPPVAVRLKDVVEDRLPSPYYHFDYDGTGRVRGVSFASGFTSYLVSYQGDRIKQMQNDALGNTDRIVYAYDDAGRVAGVRYVDPQGVTYTVVVYTYDNGKLTGVERSRRAAGGLIIDKTMTLSYYADGNLEDIAEHRPTIDGLQGETNTLDHFEQYDTGINVDGFGLLHDDFFDQFVLLPGVQLQKNNPGHETITGDGLNITVAYSYDYDAANRPKSKLGDGMITNGVNAGMHVPINSSFTYY